MGLTVLKRGQHRDLTEELFETESSTIEQNITNRMGVISDYPYEKYV